MARDRQKRIKHKLSLDCHEQHSLGADSRPEAAGRTGTGEFVSDGLLEATRENRLRVSSEGFPVLDAVVADLAA
ncbi:hypothetical protein [Methylocystis echinoides]|uniref:Uncharacterized protein n=1 Tax=Methylocystis echinoides TaxID=29468 RepID=A0A9W6GVR6_9HYPH|nr:hypothetical protein [Methylocystis echinoides]GLI93917.1 hypothetical protein LMG27198_29090 [Methylocystis echinoides]